ncbi:inositol monophosphatase family protein [Oceanibium sediminis]|uniref:inositol monophosphatase family protein n=1 Tax=Oceanibium sediminis TaxID=2026339 RepID=UPI000DD4684D|nr:inositol monophosphatase [Oceanibium sediminis]
MPKVDQDLEDRLVALVRETARLDILPHFRSLPAASIETKTNENDLVTIADKASERRLTEALAGILPSALVVGEEAASADPGLLDLLGGADLAVIVDPVDGTWNFARGLPLFGIILSVVQGGRTVLGLHYDPITDAWLAARAGQGAFHCTPDGARRRLSIDPEARGTNGFVPIFLFPKRLRSRVGPLLERYDRIMSFRCSCHEYWLLAEGHVDFSLSGTPKPWDHAAGELIYREAGGYAAMLADGQPYSAALQTGYLLAARSRQQWEALREDFLFLHSPS